jgi:hypothetical protein
MYRNDRERVEYDAWSRNTDYDPHEYFDNSVAKECRYCGAYDLWWKQTNYGWRLHEEDGTLHVCPPSKKDLEAFPLL